MNRAIRTGLFLVAASVAAPASAGTAEPAGRTVNGLTIEPSVTCAESHRLEVIYLSQSRGDPIDGVWAFCRPPSETRKSWIVMLKAMARKLSVNTDPAVRRAINRAFYAHIEKVRAEP